MDNKDTYTQVFLKAAGVEPTTKTVEDFRKVFWYSTRSKDAGGLRMTDQCLDWIESKADIKVYKIELPKDLTIGPQVLIWLDQFIESPFHLQKRYIRVLSEKAAFELYLFSGDVRKMGAAKALRRRLSQESTPD
jgi:hypothetical protein